MLELYKVWRSLWSVTNSPNSLLVPDDGVSLHELLRALKHSHIVFSQKDLHGVGAWKNEIKGIFQGHVKLAQATLKLRVVLFFF